MLEDISEKYITSIPKNLLPGLALDFIKRYKRNSCLRAYQHQNPLNPDLTTSYLQISSISKTPSQKLSQSSTNLNSFEIVAKGNKIHKNYSFHQNPFRKPLRAFPPSISLKRLYLVYPGNNHELIKTILQSRNNWEEGSFSEPYLASFIWNPNSSQIRYDRLLPYLQTQIANHFEFNNELNNKQNLYMNLLAFCSDSKLCIREIIPRTFIIEFDSKVYRSQVILFISCFKSQKKECKNVWILKPSGYNRGKGISIFRSLKEFKVLLKKSIEEKNEIKSIVIQKYIESPLLINCRKFDIRVWVLVTHEYKCYFCKEGYLRTSSEPFNLENSSLKNEYIHLTNNAIQQKGTRYGKFEEGNQLPLETLEDYLPGGHEKFLEISKRMREMICYSLLSVKNKLNSNKRQYSFEIFGYDFIIDSQSNIWLIECNTNPCLELSSKLLSRIIPKMLNHAFTLTIDKIFADPQPRTHPEDNVWEFLLNIKHQQQSIP